MKGCVLTHSPAHTCRTCPGLHWDLSAPAAQVLRTSTGLQTTSFQGRDGADPRGAEGRSGGGYKSYPSPPLSSTLHWWISPESHGATTQHGTFCRGTNVFSEESGLEPGCPACTSQQGEHGGHWAFLHPWLLICEMGQMRIPTIPLTGLTAPRTLTTITTDLWESSSFSDIRIC